VVEKGIAKHKEIKVGSFSTYLENIPNLIVALF
jgi:hypothetical protein